MSDKSLKRLKRRRNNNASELNSELSNVALRSLFESQMLDGDFKRSKQATKSESEIEMRSIEKKIWQVKTSLDSKLQLLEQFNEGELPTAAGVHLLIHLVNFIPITRTKLMEIDAEIHSVQSRLDAFQIHQLETALEEQQHVFNLLAERVQQVE